MLHRFVFLFTVALLLPTTVRAGTLAERIADVDDGEVRMTYASRPGVYGDGHSITSFHAGDVSGRCMDEGPLRVSLHIRDGEVFRVRSMVGGSWHSPGRSAVDLGTVDAGEAADYLMDLAFTGRSGPAEDAICPAALARDVVLWPRLVDLARNHDRPADVREQARFWLSQEASWAVHTDSGPVIPEIEVKKQAVFALSQGPERESVPALIRIAETHSSPEVRGSALFWLHQTADERAVDTFEAILRENTDTR